MPILLTPRTTLLLKEQSKHAQETTFNLVDLSSFQGIEQNANAGVCSRKLGYTKNYPVSIITIVHKQQS
jgi:hypothetical protein